MIGPARFFALRVSVRLQEQPSESQPFLGSCFDLLLTAQIVNISSFVVCFKQKPLRLCLLVVSRFLTFGRLVQLLVLVVHGLPF